jgi:hypothetical protein
LLCDGQIRILAGTDRKLPQGPPSPELVSDVDDRLGNFT